MRLCIGFVYMATLAVVTMVLALPLLPWRVLRIKLCNYYGKVVGPVLVWIARATPVFHHRERIAASYPAIYVSNHTSTLDAFIAIWLCPVGGCGVVKKEVADIPFFGWLYRLSGHLKVNRSDHQGAVAALKSTAEVVRRHRLSMWIWPEGTRSRDGRLLPLKKGFVHLAIATGLPVVPVVVHGAHKNWAKHAFTLHPVTVDVFVLPPVDTSNWQVSSTDAHCAEIHAILADALPPDQKPLPAGGAAAAPAAPQGSSK